jgi:transcriptional regulator with XRE-family HTH domain
LPGKITQEKTMTNKTIGYRLAIALKEKSRSRKELAKFCGVSSSAVTQWCNDSTSNLKMENLFATAKFLGISPSKN